jgi:FkbM family methyltransferase
MEFLGYQHGGTYMEAGASDGRFLSNTYILEKHYGWRGLLVEALPDMVEIARGCRPGSVVVEGALYDEDDVMLPFSALPSGQRSDLLSGLSSELQGTHIEFMDYITQHGEMPKHLFPRSTGKSSVTSLSVRACTLRTLLQQASLPIVDFFSLDIEGAELRALQGIDWSTVIINILLIEENYPSHSAALAVRRLIDGTGLYHTPPIKFGHDLIYLRKQFVWSWDAQRPASSS